MDNEINDWCYELYIKKVKPKGIFKNIYYFLWKTVGVSPSGIVSYVYRKGQRRNIK